MKLRIKKSGFAAGVVLAMGMVFFADGAFAGWVIEMESAPEKPPARAGASGAGEANLTYTSAYTTIKIQDKQIRMDFDDESLIYGKENAEGVMLFPDEKSYWKMKAKPKAMGSQDAAKEPAVAKSTGRTDKINGFSVEEYVAQTPQEKTTFWVSKEGANVENLRNAMADMFGKINRAPRAVECMSLPGYPIKTIIETPERTETMEDGKSRTIPLSKISHTVKSIKEEKLDEAVFKVPTGYKEEVEGGAGGKG